MKQIKTADELNALVAMAVHRVAELVEVGGAQTAPADLIQPGMVYWHEPDDAGRDWNMSNGRHLGPFTGAVEVEVNKLRDKFSLQRADVPHSGE